MANRLARSLERLGTETAFETLARARALEAEGRRIIHLEIGEPDFPTAPHIVEAAAKALRDGHTHYCQAPGLPALREACAEHLSRHRGLEIDPGRVLVAPGAKPFLFFGVLATCDAADEADHSQLPRESDRRDRRPRAQRRDRAHPRRARLLDPLR